MGCPADSKAEPCSQRLETDFELVRMLGRGEFGTVSLYRHRLGMRLCGPSDVADGVLYAIKRSNNPIHGQAHE